MIDLSIKLPRYVKLTTDELEFYGNKIVLVNHASRSSRKNQVLKFAEYFRREFEYDFVQFGGEYENDLDFEAWLFLPDHPSRVGMNYENILPIGACCFRYRKGHYTCLPGNHWALQWIWLHPYFRSKGIFKRAFPLFRERYGLFIPEPPFSRSMQEFLSKHYRECLIEGVTVPLP